MERLEQDLRQGFERQVASPPPLPHLADAVIRRGKRVRRLQVASAVAAVVAVLALAAPVVTGVRDQALQLPAAPPHLSGPPRVPLVTHGIDEITEIIDWRNGKKRLWLEGEGVQPLAAVPAGVLYRGSEGLLLLEPERTRLDVGLARDPFVSVPPEQPIAVPSRDAIAVSAAGERVTLVVGEGRKRQLQEIDVASGAFCAP